MKLHLLAFLGFGACSCAKPIAKPVVLDYAGVTHAAEPAAAEPPTRLVLSSDWALTLPSSYQKTDSTKTSAGTTTTFVNKANNNSVSIVTEPYVGEYKAYITGVVRDLKERRVAIKSATQAVVKDGLYVILDTEKDSLKLRIWITHYHEVGYTFSCGGLASEAWHEAICDTIVQTLTIRTPP